MTTAVVSAAEKLDRDCHCTVTDLVSLGSSLDDRLVPAESLSKTHPHLFSGTPVFLAPAHFAQMQRMVEAVEELVQVPAYQDVVTAGAPASA